LKDFLVNYDLIAADISVLEESDVEHEICANLTDGLLVSTGRKILAEIERLSDYGAEAFPWGENVDDVKNRHVSALRDLARTLVTRGSAMEHEFMESLVEQNVLCLDDLPPDLRRAVETHHLTDRFLEGINGYLRYLQNPSGADQARKLAATLYRITPDLVYRAEYGALARVLEVISQGRQRPKVSSFFEQLANYILKALSSDNLLQHQLEALASEEKEQRQSLATIFTFIGDTTIPGLLKVYDSTQDRALRMCIFEVVRAMGGTALRPFLARLKRVESDWAIVRHALSEVGDSGETSLATSCSDFVDHPNPHVRHSALSALFKLVRGQAEQEFIAALSDDDPEVRQTAVSYLGAIGSRHPDALAYYSQVLDPDSEADPEADGVLIETCRAISVVGSSEKQAGLANAILLAALQPVKSKGVFGKLKRSAPRFGEHVLQAVLEALSEVGTREAIPHIEELAAADEALASTAAATIESIKDRSKQTEP
jgi:HEAT repeat protein